MKEKNLAVELLKKLIAEQAQIYRRTNVVKSEKFSEIIQRAMNAYLNGMLTFLAAPYTFGGRGGNAWKPIVFIAFLYWY